MEAIGTWLVMIGSALAVAQAVWVITATGRRRTLLRREKRRSDAREARINAILIKLREGWGDEAADISNYEDQKSYQPDPELERLRAIRASLMEQRIGDGWVRTWNDFRHERSSKNRELIEAETEWKHLWTFGVPGLVGGVLSLIGGALIAFGVPS